MEWQMKINPSEELKSLVRHSKSSNIKDNKSLPPKIDKRLIIEDIVYILIAAAAALYFNLFYWS
jgi:hypothetical protein